MKEQITITEYAAILGVTRDTIHKRLAKDGKLTGVSKITVVGTGLKLLTVDRKELKAKAI